MITFEVTLSDETIETIAMRAAQIVLATLNTGTSGKPYLTVSEAAEYLRAKPQRVYDLLSSRRLTRHKDGARVLVSRSELDAYLRV
jgi:excisionase family DNA binding protein